MPALQAIDPRDYELFKTLFPQEFFAPGDAPTFGRSYEFDFDAGDFATTTRGTVAETNQVRTLEQAILKVLLTARWRFGIYNEYGAGIDRAVGHANGSLIAADMKFLIRTSLQRDNRVTRINEITIAPQGDKVFVKIDVTAITGESVRVARELER